MIKKAWEQRKLGEFYSFKNGINKGKEFFGKGTPILNYVDVYHNRSLEGYDIKGQVAATEQDQSNYSVKDGDIFFTRTSETIDEVGYPAVVDQVKPRTVFSGFLIRARAINSNDPLSNSFKRYAFYTTPFRIEMMRKSTMTTRALTSGKNLSDMVMKYPLSKNEQDLIGYLLIALDRNITLQQRKLDLLKQLKKGLLQKIFADKNTKLPFLRFQGFNDAWEQQKLGDVARLYSGGTPSVSNSDYYGGTIPFIRSAEINSISTELYLSKQGLQNSSAKMVRRGDILYALYGATSGEVGISKINGAINQAILAIIPNKNYDSIFLAQWLRKNKEAIIKTYLQGGQGNLSGAIVRQIKISFPNFDEQEKIGEFFKQLDPLIALHQRRINILSNLKKFLLQKLFI